MLNLPAVRRPADSNVPYFRDTDAFPHLCAAVPHGCEGVVTCSHFLSIGKQVPTWQWLLKHHNDGTSAAAHLIPCY